MKRSIIIEGTGQELVISRAAAVTIKNEFIYIDELPDKTWRLNFHPKTIDDFSKIEYIKIHGLEKTFPQGMPKRLPGDLFGVEVELGGIDVRLPLSRISIIDSPLGVIRFDCGMYYGRFTWKLIYSRALLPDLVNWPGLTMMREG